MFKLFPSRWWPALLVGATLLWGGAKAARADAPPVNFHVWTVPSQPPPVGVGEGFGIGVGSSITAAPPNGVSEENLMTESQQWYITSVSYSTDDQTWTSEWSGQADNAQVANFFNISIAGGVGGGTISGTVGNGGQAGFYLIAFTSEAYVSATVNGQEKSGMVTANGSTTQPAVKVDITYTGPIVSQTGNDNGTIVTNETEKVHAGWPIQLGAVVSPGLLAGKYTKFTWTIAGHGGNGSAAINGYVSNESTGAPVVPGKLAETGQAFVVALAPANDTKSTFPDPLSSGILNHYYYTKSGSFNASVQPQGVNGVSAKTTFVVTAPTTKMVAKYQYKTRNIPTAKGSLANYIYLEATAPMLADASPLLAQEGILFTHPVVHGTTVNATTFQGTSYFVQVYTEDDLWTGIGPNVQNHSLKGVGLDGSDPYGGNNPTSGIDENGGAPSRVTDAFDNQVNYSPVIINDSATMWVMYTPGVPGSIDIPLASCGWKWGGTLTWNAAARAWSLTNASPAATGNTPAEVTNKYPVWSQMLPLPGPLPK